MDVNILCYEPAGGWILYDYAEKLATGMRSQPGKVEVTFSQVPGYDVTFHINYWGLRQLLVPGLHCTMVTHIDSVEKFNLVKAQAEAGVWGFCMSEETARRLNTLTGIERFVSFPPPAMIEAEAKQITVMIAGRLYVDGRKNEAWAIDFFKRFAPGSLIVRIMGSGWDPYVNELREMGYVVEYYDQFASDTYQEILKTSDYLLVTGFDEGALSTLDAILFGVTPIVTAQGYHLEQNADLIIFSTRDQLMRIADKLQREIDETNQLRTSMTDWVAFAKKHQDQWQSILIDSGATAGEK
jgi:hypothetical protein